jgi:hypothetical protein
MGHAVIRHKTLIVYRLTGFKSTWSKDKEQKIINYIQSLVEDHSVRHIGLRIVPAEKSSKTLQKLSKKVTQLAKDFGVTISTYTLNDLRDGIELGVKSTLAENLVQRFPELNHVHRKYKNSLNSYHTKLFEAIGTAVLTEINSVKESYSKSVC